MATFNQDNFLPRMQQGEDKNKVRLVGFELEVKREDREKEDWLHYAVASIDGFANYGFDGDDIEIVSDPISTSLLVDDSFIKDITEELNKNDCSACPGGGTHINVSKLPSDSKYTYENLLWLQMVFTTQMQKVFGRISNWARNPIDCMFRNGTRTYDKKRLAESNLMKLLMDLNFTSPEIAESLSKHNSKALLITDKGNRYEFRGGKSSIDELEILAWGEFCVNMVKAASKSSIERVKFSQFIKGPHIEKYFADVIQKNDARKLKDADLKKTARSKQKITIIERRNRIF